MDRNDLPFTEVLDRLFSEPTVTISLVYRLSDMTAEEMERFTARWPEQSDRRRRVIARHMADISEGNFVVDFSLAFRFLLADPSREVRLAALDGLWDTSNTDLVPPIIDLMQTDAEEDVRAAAAATLGHFILMGEWGQINHGVAEHIVQALLGQLDHEDTAESVRRATVESLGNAAHPRIPDIIGEAYHRGNDSMQLSAIFAMGRSADRQWVPIIIDEMLNPSAEMRVEAARAAGNIGASDSVDRLIELLDDEELDVQLAAVTSLGQIGSDRAYEALQRLATDAEALRLVEAIEDALDEIEWLGGEIDLSLFEWDEDEDAIA